MIRVNLLSEETQEQHAKDEKARKELLQAFCATLAIHLIAVLLVIIK